MEIFTVDSTKNERATIKNFASKQVINNIVYLSKQLCCAQNLCSVPEHNLLIWPQTFSQPDRLQHSLSSSICWQSPSATGSTCKFIGTSKGRDTVNGIDISI